MYWLCWFYWVNMYLFCWSDVDHRSVQRKFLFLWNDMLTRWSTFMLKYNIWPIFLFQKRRFIWNLGWENWYCLKSQDIIAVMITKVMPLRMQSFNNMHVPVGNIILKINFQIHMNNGFLIFFLMQFFGIISSSLHSS